jgi:hypothetical protein
MCGIVGFSGKSEYNVDKIKLLMYWNSVERGKDSTGVYTPIKGIIKEAESASKFICNDLNIFPDNFLIGHVRYKTTGIIKKENAHPFQHDNIVGVHNGTISNIWSLVSENGLKSIDYDVDSDALFAIIAKNENLSILSKTEGPLAIVFTDVNKFPNTLYCFRNSERTLFRGKIGEDMYISSIKEPLEAIGCEEVKEFKENCLYTIVDGKIENTLKIKIKVKEQVNIQQSCLNSYTDLNINDLVGKWVMADSDYFWFAGVSVNIKRGNFYYVKSRANNGEYMIKVIDGDNKEVEISKYSINRQSSVILPNTKVILTCDLISTDGERKSIGSKNDVVLVKTVNNPEKTADCELIDGVYSIRFSHLRNLSANEKLAIKNEEIPEVVETIEQEDTINEESEEIIDNINISDIEQLSNLVEELRHDYIKGFPIDNKLNEIDSKIMEMYEIIDNSEICDLDARK